MTVTNFSIHRGYEIKCKLFKPEDGGIDHVVVGVHGFAGDKDSSMLKNLAKSLSGTALLCFDFPAHGESPADESSFTVKNCMLDLLAVCNWSRENYPNARKAIFATSFGGYVSLLSYDSISDFKFVLRAPAITMADVLLSGVLKMSEDEFKENERVITGFERKIYLPYSFYLEMRSLPCLLERDFAVPMLIIHGDRDDIVPPQVIYEFSRKNSSATLKIIEGADHRFKNRGESEALIESTKNFLEI